MFCTPRPHRSYPLWHRKGLRKVLFIFGCLILCGHFLVGSAQAKKGSLDDKDIRMAIEGTLLVDPVVPGHLIDVRVDSGIAQISGFVRALRAKTRTAKIAKTIKGVQGVVNLIKVKRGSFTDQELREEVMRVLQEDPVTDSFDLEVKVRDGQATLFGEVSSWSAKLLTNSVASETYGITAIHDEITIAEEPKRTDNEIADEIRARLEMDVWVFDPTIRIDVENGKVTLKGTVRSVAEKDRAYQNAKVSGVTSVDADDLKAAWKTVEGLRRVEKPSIKSDEKIAKAIELAFHYDPRVSSVNPQVSIDEGNVTLTGTVSNLKAKKAAEQDVTHTMGVRMVKNLLKVRPPHEISDPDLEEKIRKAIQREPHLDPLDVIVSVKKGKVRLHGRVESVYEKVLAEDLSAKVRGTVDVRNHLKIDADWRWKPDWVIYKNIQNELWWSPFVNSENITVSVKDGIATLRGTVNNWAEFGVAIENAFEGGAKSVRNTLMVGDQPSEGSELFPEFIYDLPFFP